MATWLSWIKLGHASNPNKNLTKMVIQSVRLLNIFLTFQIMKLKPYTHCGAVLLMILASIILIRRNSLGLIASVLVWVLRDTFVSLPSVRWDGNYESKSLDDFTAINLEAFGDLVESICHQLLTLASNDELETVLPGGSDELLHRYSIFTLTNEQDAAAQR